MNVLPFQCQSRACEPPLGKQRALSDGRKTAVSTRISWPTATTGGKMNPACWKTSCQALPAKVKTAHRWGDQQVGAAIVTAIACEPEPVNGPQSTCAIGFGSKKAMRWFWSTSRVAVASEQL